MLEDGGSLPCTGHGRADESESHNHRPHWPPLDLPCIQAGGLQRPRGRVHLGGSGGRPPQPHPSSRQGKSTSEEKKGSLVTSTLDSACPHLRPLTLLRGSASNMITAPPTLGGSGRWKKQRAPQLAHCPCGFPNAPCTWRARKKKTGLAGVGTG